VHCDVVVNSCDHTFMLAVYSKGSELLANDVRVVARDNTFALHTAAVLGCIYASITAQYEFLVCLDGAKESIIGKVGRTQCHCVASHAAGNVDKCLRRLFWEGLGMQ